MKKNPSLPLFPSSFQSEAATDLLPISVDLVVVVKYYSVGFHPPHFAEHICHVYLVVACMSL